MQSAVLSMFLEIFREKAVFLFLEKFSVFALCKNM